MSKYDRRIRGKDGVVTTVDVYDVLKAFNVTCPATAHAIKKLLAPGERGHKNKLQDLAEAKVSIDRAIQLEEPVAQLSFPSLVTKAQAESLTRYKGNTCPNCGDAFPPQVPFCHNVNCSLSVVKLAGESDEAADKRKAEVTPKELADHLAKTPPAKWGNLPDDPPACLGCGGTDHVSANCPRNGRALPPPCQYCRSQDHLSQDCDAQPRKG